MCGLIVFLINMFAPLFLVTGRTVINVVRTTMSILFGNTKCLYCISFPFVLRVGCGV